MIPESFLLRVTLALLSGLLALAPASLQGGGEPPVPASAMIAPVWAGHPVSFAFQAAGGKLFVAFYDAERRITVGQRAIAGGPWTLVRPEGVWNERHQRFSNVVGWDSHNSLVLAFDRDGFVHLSGNLHVDPLVYYRSTKPYDIRTLERLDRMTGDREADATYPVFFHDAAGALYFRYRDGSSGKGSDIYNRYDVGTRTWAHLLETPLHDGEGQRNAYALDPILGPDGRFHVVWMWRNTPDAATNHTLSYVRTADLKRWEDAHGREITLPIRLGGGDVVDPAKPGEGLINTTFTLGFDRFHRPVILYHRYDDKAQSQLFAAKPADHAAGGWERRALTDWKFRWAFGGTGTLATDVYVRSPRRAPDGTLLLPVFVRSTGESRLRVDPDTLAVLGTLPAEPPPLPTAAMEPTRPGMVVHTRTAQSGDRTFILRWETLPTNRDRPRDEAPSPAELRLYELPRP